MTYPVSKSFAAVLTVFYATSGCGMSVQSEEPRATVEDRLLEALASSSEINAIVNFRETVERDASPHEHRNAIRISRARILHAAVDGFVLTHQYNDVPAIAGRLSRNGLDALSKAPNVTSIQLDEVGHGALKISVPTIKADVAQKTYNVTGKGVTVAVLDSGVNTTHRDLKSSVMAEYCVTHGACPPNNSLTGTSAEDDNGHGSNVTGIITSDGTVAGAGFAPDAAIVAVKIDDKNDSGLVSDWIAGLQWVYDNLAELKVKVINMSICTTTLYASGTACDSGQPAFEAIVDKLVKAGVTIFAASGNNGSNSQLSAPACLTGVIAVGATYKSDQGRQPQSGTYSQWTGFGNCTDSATAFDQVACFTNSNARLDILAPGAIIESDYMGGTSALSQYRGTSQASPSAAGVAALMLECNPNLTPSEVKSILVSTAVLVKDSKNNLSFPSIRADAALKAACESKGGASGTGGTSAVGGVTSMGGTGTAGGTSANGGEATGGGSFAVGGRTSGGTSNSSASGGLVSETGGASSTHGTTGGASVDSGGSRATGGVSASLAVGGAVSATGGQSSTTGGSPASVSGTPAGGTPDAGGLPTEGGSSPVAGGGSSVNSTGGAGIETTSSSAPPAPATRDETASCSCRVSSASQRRSMTFAGLCAIFALALARRNRRAHSPIIVA